MTKKDLENLKQTFFKKLEWKTSWGKEEVKKLWLETVVEFLIDAEHCECGGVKLPESEFCKDCI